MAEKNQAPKSKSIWSKLKDMAIEDTDSKNENEEVQVSEEEINAASRNTTSAAPKFNYSSAPAVNSVPGYVPQGQFDQNYYNHFSELLEEKNLPGTDYLELVKAKRKMDSNPQFAGMAEAAKFNSAYIALSSNDEKLTKDSLLKSADFYLEVLQQEEAEFTKEHASELENEVTARLREVEKETAEIAKLNAQIQEKQQRVAQFNSDAEAARIKLDFASRNFKATVEIYKGQIQQDKVSIQNFLV